MTSEPKQCIADRILLYIEQVFSTADFSRIFTHANSDWRSEPRRLETSSEARETARHIALNIYRNYVRGNEDIVNGANPRPVAAAIVYVACIHTANCYLSQNNIALALGISTASIPKYVHRIRRAGYKGMPW